MCDLDYCADCELMLKMPAEQTHDATPMNLDTHANMLTQAASDWGMLSKVQEKHTGQMASQDLPGMCEPNLRALKAELEANGMFLHAKHMCELQKLSDKCCLQQMTSIFIDKSDPGRCCI